MMGLFENKICGITNKILGIANKILVLFDRSIRIPRAHARIHKVYYPCNRCHLATLLENQRVTCGNEVTRVTTNGVFALKIHSTLRYRGTEFLLFLRVFVSLCLPKYCMWVVKPGAPWVEARGFEGRRCRLQGPEVPPPWGEGTGFMPLGDYL